MATTILESMHSAVHILYAKGKVTHPGISLRSGILRVQPSFIADRMLAIQSD
jgi:hypothetical protein